MFGNFLHYIVVLILLSTYQPAEGAARSHAGSIFFISSIFFIFLLYTRYSFFRLKRSISGSGLKKADIRLDALIQKLTIAAVILMAVYIYGFNLTYLLRVPIPAAGPTMEAVAVLAIFVLHQWIIYYNAYPVYRWINPFAVSRPEYVKSNIQVSLPVLIPWFFLSLVSDILFLIPFEAPKRFLSTTGGQITYFMLFLAILAIVGPYLIQKFWRCTPLPDGFMRRRIADLCKRAGVKYSEILNWPIFGGRMLTAGVMGLVRRFRYILVTRSLLEVLEPEEVDAVIAHEIGHVKKHHLLLYIIFLVGYLVLTYSFFNLIIYAILTAAPLYSFLDPSGLNHEVIFSSIIGLLLIISFLLYFRYVFGYFMRNFERQADLFIFSLFDTAGPLISTLKKIAAASGQSPEKPNWHHFSIKERIDCLVSCENNPEERIKHEKKVRRSLLAYLGVMLVIGTLGYHINFGETGRRLNNSFFIKALEYELRENPSNRAVLGFLGDLYQANGSYIKAAETYEEALLHFPENPRILNNYAWLLATAKEVRNPDKAVYLAEKAVLISPAPHIIDTLAESYFAAGRIDEAIRAETIALKKDPKNAPYYESQLEKFRKAANRK